MLNVDPTGAQPVPQILGAQPVPQILATLDIQRPIPLDALYENVAAQRACGAVVGAPTQAPNSTSPAVAGGEWEVSSEQGWFRFTELGPTTACGEMRYNVTIPAGTGSGRVTFDANRVIGASEALYVAATNIHQETRWYTPAGEQLASWPLYDPRGPPSPERTSFSIPVPTTTGPDHQVLAWFVSDEGTLQTGEEGVGNPFSVFGANATFWAPRLEFNDVAWPLASLTHQAMEPQGNVTTTQHRATLVLNSTAVPGAALQFRVAAPWQLVGVRGPDGLPITRFYASPSNNSLEVFLPRAVINEAGPGAYHFEMTSSTPVPFLATAPRVPGLWPAAVGAMFAPVAGIGAAAYGVGKYAREATGPYRATTRRLAVLVLVCVAYFAVLLTFTWRIGAAGQMATYPVTTLGTILYSQYGLVTAALFATGIVAGVRMTAALRERIRERRILEVKMRQAMHDLARSNEELQQFATVASHDLQEPLRKVVAYTQMLEARYGDGIDEEGRRYLARAADGARRMQRLIRDLLALSRVGRGEEAPVLVDSGEVLRGVLDDLDDALRDAEGEVRVGPLPRVLGNPTEVGQLFLNLISNAIKFRQPGVAPVIDVAATWRADLWHFTVADNGIGIAAGDTDRIFQLFRRLHDQQDYEGTGIGLALCRKVVDRHGGRLWVESVPGQGAMFHFTLPGPGEGQ